MISRFSPVYTPLKFKPEEFITVNSQQDKFHLNTHDTNRCMDWLILVEEQFCTLDIRIQEELKILFFPSIKGDLDTWRKSVLGIPRANWPWQMDGYTHYFGIFHKFLKIYDKTFHQFPQIADMNSGTSLLYPKFSKFSEFKAAQWCRQPIQFDYRILSFCEIFTGCALLSHVIVDIGILDLWTGQYPKQGFF